MMRLPRFPTSNRLESGGTEREGPHWMAKLVGLRHPDPLSVGVAVSIVLHGLLLSIHFKPPEPLQFKAEDSQLEVVLLNAGTEATPLKPEVLAQISSVGGGDRDTGRSKSPLPAQEQNNDGEELMRQKAQVEKLEAEQAQLLSALRERSPTLSNLRDNKEIRPDPGPDQTETRAVLARMQAEIEKSIEDYNKRPKRLTFGINARGVTFAEYVDNWTRNMEQLGTTRYPAEARGKLYDSLIMTVEIRSDGTVASVVLNQKSKYEVLNRAARAIVYAGQPYDRFPPEMARQADILQIVRTWYFTNDGINVEATK